MSAPPRCMTGTTSARPSWNLNYVSAAVQLLAMCVIRMMLATASGSPGSPGPARPGSRVNRRPGRSLRSAFRRADWLGPAGGPLSS